jgi:hypothetical protein
MALMAKLKGVAAITAVALAAHAYESGVAVKPAHHGATSAAAPAAVSGPITRNANEALANQMAASRYGWRGTQLTCLDELWTRESGFSQYADTRRTHAGGDGPGSPVFAYGVAQARPATKYPKAGQPADLGGSSDAATQIRWGLADISSVYGTPCGAWGHETAQGWY